MELFEQIRSGRTPLSVVGLGYVGMPLAVSFAGKGASVIGFDISRSRIEAYRSGIDFTREVGDEAVKNSGVRFTWEESALREARFHIVAVPRDEKVIIDVKSILPKERLLEEGYRYWRL